MKGPSVDRASFEQAQMRRQHRLLRDGVHARHSGVRVCAVMPAQNTPAPSASSPRSSDTKEEVGGDANDLVLVRVDGTQPSAIVKVGQSLMFKRDASTKGEQGYLGHFVSRGGNFMLTRKTLSSFTLSVIQNNLNPPRIARHSHRRSAEHDQGDTTTLYAGDMFYVIGGNNKARLHGKPKILFTIQAEGSATLESSEGRGSTSRLDLSVGQHHHSPTVSGSSGFDGFDIMLLCATPVPVARVHASSDICMKRKGSTFVEIVKAKTACCLHLGDTFCLDGRTYELTQRIFDTSVSLPPQHRVTKSCKRGVRRDTTTHSMKSKLVAEAISPDLIPPRCESCGGEDVGMLHPCLNKINELRFLCSSCDPDDATLLDPLVKEQLRIALMRRNTALCIYELLDQTNYVYDQEGPPSKKLRAFAASPELTSCTDKAEFCNLFEEFIEPEKLMPPDGGFLL